MVPDHKQDTERPDPLDLLALVSLCIAVIITALIAFVIVAGVIQGKLNPTAVATMLGGVLTTIVGILFTRANIRNKTGKDEE